MKTLLIMLLLTFPAYAWDNPAPPPAVAFITVPHDRPSMLTLEAGRVGSVTGDRFTYHLGQETITIEAGSVTVRQFLERVHAGRRDATCKTILKPVIKSPYNTRFKTIDN